MNPSWTKHLSPSKLHSSERKRGIKIGEYSSCPDIPQIFQGIFSHVTRYDQSYKGQNIWRVIINSY